MVSSLLKRAAIDINSPQFKAWFKGSKVVDPTTKQPLRVIHGTTKSIDKFDQKPLAYFTPDPEYSRPFSYKHFHDENFLHRQVPDARPQSVAVYLRILRPLDVRKKPDMTLATYVKITGLQVSDLDEGQELMESPFRHPFWWYLRSMSEATKKALMRSGYDGIFQMEYNRGMSTTAYVAFSDDQVMSAYSGGFEVQSSFHDGTWHIADIKGLAADEYNRVLQLTTVFGKHVEIVRYPSEAGPESQWTIAYKKHTVDPITMKDNGVTIIHLRPTSGPKKRASTEDLMAISQRIRKHLPHASEGDCADISQQLGEELVDLYPSTELAFGTFDNVEHVWVEIPDIKTYIDPTHDQFGGEPIMIGTTNSDYFRDHYRAVDYDEPTVEAIWKMGGVIMGEPDPSALRLLREAGFEKVNAPNTNDYYFVKGEWVVIFAPATDGQEMDGAVCHENNDEEIDFHTSAQLQEILEGLGIRKVL